jgi:two-component system, OmpR family, sensor histidine kinase KdpD
MATTAPSRRELAHLGAAVIVLVGLTAAYRGLLPVANPTTVSLSYLLVILLLATRCGLWVSVAAAVLATTLFNYYFLPPTGTFTIRDIDNWVALFVFLIVAFVATNLSTAARARAQEAIARRDEVTRLFDLSRDILLTTESATALPSLPRHIARRFQLDTVTLFLPRPDGWTRHDGGVRASTLERAQLDAIFAQAGGALEFDARRRTYGGQQTVLGSDGTPEAIVPLRMGTEAVGLLGASGASTGLDIDPGTLDAVAGVAAIAVERATFLEERKEAELERQRAELASALLASFSHDLRTPLTAIRVAVANLLDSALDEESRREQGDVALREVHRLNRAFEVILDMARIDAGISPERIWATPAEVVDAALVLVGPALGAHRLEIEAEPDREVEIDPRLTAAALAHVIENAAQHSPAGSVIRIVSEVAVDGLEASVSDEGSGIDALDIEHLFDRFYQGKKGKSGSSGLGLGLSITRGLLSAEGGRIWAENRPEGGARFEIVVPARSREASLASGSN